MAIASDFLIGANDEHGLNPPTVGKRTPLINYIGRSFYENEFNNQAKLMFMLACLRCGFNVYDVHPEEQDISVSNRVVRANRAGVSLLVTFAYNASGNGLVFNNARGIEVYYSRLNSFANESRRLSELVYNKLVENTNVPGRFVGTLSVGVLTNVRAPSTLIEAGFMTNWLDAKLMLNPSYVINVAESTCQAVCEFLAVPYVSRELVNYQTIRLNSRGNFVRILQYLLNWYGNNLVVDGVFGVATQRAVQEFQRNNNLAVDGIVGRNTWNKLLNVNPQSEVLKRGSESAAVMFLQRLLLSYLYPITQLDGDFGPETERAVRDFQAENGLTVDGIVGRNTWQRLLNSNGRPQNQN